MPADADANEEDYAATLKAWRGALPALSPPNSPNNDLQPAPHPSPPPRPQLVQRHLSMSPGLHTLKEHPALFRRFADLKLSAAAALHFANEFGLLVDGDHLIVAPWHVEPAGHTSILSASHRVDTSMDDTSEATTKELIAAGAVVPAELLDTWMKEIRTLKAAVQLWEATERHDEDILRQLIKWDESPQGRFACYGNWRFSTNMTKAQTHTEAAFDILDWLIDDAVGAGHWKIHAQAWKHWGARRGLVQLRWKRGWNVEPPNLLGAMWLQFATAVDEHEEFKACPARNCPRGWFKVTRGSLGPGTRNHADFCSSLCRHTAYRDRKAKAREMFKAGQSVNRMVKELGTDAATVRGWIRA